MFPAQKLKKAVEQFEKDMTEAKPAVIKQDLQEIHKYSNHRDYGSRCHDVMWRFLSSMRSAYGKLCQSQSLRDKEHEAIYRRRFFQVRDLLDDSLNILKIDDHNKRVALEFMQKHRLGITPKLKEFLHKKESDGKRYYSTGQRIKQIQDYYAETGKFDSKEFAEKTREFFTLLTDRDVDIKYAHFSKLYGLMERQANQKEQAVQGNLFEDTYHGKNTIDKKLLEDSCRIYVDVMSNHRSIENYNQQSMHKFSLMLKAAVRKNSFSREEVKSLAKLLKDHHFTNGIVERHLNETANSLVDEYDKKQEKEINNLLDWSEKNQKQRSLEQVVMQSVLSKMLYQKLVADEDIGKENFGKKYNEEKDRLQREIAQKYKEVDDNKKAQEEVIKINRQKNRERYDIVSRKLDKKCQDSRFYIRVINAGINNGLADKPKQIHPAFTLDGNLR